MLMDSIQFLTGADHNYDIAGSSMLPPQDNDVVMRFRANRAFKLPINLVGSVFYAEQSPSGGDAVLEIQKNDSAIGTLTFSSGANEPTITFAQDVSFAVGDRLEVVCTTANSIDQIYLTFKTLAV